MIKKVSGREHSRADRGKPCPYDGTTRACDGRTGASPVPTYLSGIDRKGRNGVNPSTTHLLVLQVKMCRRGTCSLATLAVAGHLRRRYRYPQRRRRCPITHCVVQFAPLGLAPTHDQVSVSVTRSSGWASIKIVGIHNLNVPHCSLELSSSVSGLLLF